MPMLSTTLFALAQAGDGPKASTVVSSLLLVVAVTFVISVIVTKIVANTANVNDATFGKAFLATIFKNIAGWGSLVFLGLAPGMSPIFTIGFAFALVPILVYKMVFGTEWMQALVIWVAVFVIEVGVGFAVAGPALKAMLKI